VLLLKVYFERAKNPRASPFAANHVRCRHPVGAAHGNREMDFLPSCFVLFEVSMESGCEGDWFAKKQDDVSICAHPRHGVVGDCSTLGLSQSLDTYQSDRANQQAR
jgi:hypothetical protein